MLLKEIVEKETQKYLDRIQQGINEIIKEDYTIINIENIFIDYQNKICIVFNTLNAYDEEYEEIKRFD